jgi:hypothetical protein
VVESLEPERTKLFELKVTTPDPAEMRSAIEGVLQRYHITYELRTAASKDLVYETELPLHTRTDRVANAILSLDDKHETEVTWDEKKKK